MTDVRTLEGQFEAFQIAKRLEVAYWTNETPDEPGYHLNEAHNTFKEMAEKMGYRIERIES